MLCSGFYLLCSGDHRSLRFSLTQPFSVRRLDREGVLGVFFGDAAGSEVDGAPVRGERHGADGTTGGY